MIYKINQYYLKIECDIKKYTPIITARVTDFGTEVLDATSKIDASIVIEKNKTIVNYRNGEHQTVEGVLLETDIYPLMYNVIASLINDDSNVLMHSCVISKAGEGILLLGTFGQGKTSLALFAETQGYEINSSDQSWLHVKNAQLFLKKGSSMIKYGEGKPVLKTVVVREDVLINQILLLYGMAENGSFSETIINIKSRYFKTLYQYVSWSSAAPLLTDFSFLKNCATQSFGFFEKVFKQGVELKIVRGGNDKILK